MATDRLAPPSEAAASVSSARGAPSTQRAPSTRGASSIGTGGSVPRPGAAGTQPKNARRRSRELVVQGLYQWLLSGEDSGAIEAHVAETNPGFAKANREYFKTLLHGTIEAAADLDALIAPHLDRKTIELSPVEHAVLLLASYELSKMPEVPYRVVINEAVELTKTYGGTDGYKYVNGVLDRIAAKARAVETGQAHDR